MNSFQMDATTFLLNNNIKPSLQRLAVAEYMLNNRIHPTAEDIFKALSPSMPTLSRTTIYNTLKLFLEQGAVLELGIENHSAHYDIDTSNHGHMLCLNCGALYDVPPEVAPTIEVPHIENFTVTEVHYYLKGYCYGCSGKQN